jgi:ADP-heptose:LPS heptosyltransferase
MITKPCGLFIVNFNGIGNGICVVPLLQRIEASWPTVVYYHTDNLVLRTPAFLGWAGLRNFRGTTPSAWRRFDRRDWDDIISFLQSNDLNVVINLRNEGPSRDIGYFAFKKSLAGTRIQFWELNHSAVSGRSPPRLLLLEQATLLAELGVNLTGFDGKWLRSAPPLNRVRVQRGTVGLFTGASQDVKRWPAERWGRLVGRLQAAGCAVVVYAGTSQDEIRLARNVVHEAGGTCGHLTLAQTGSLERLTVDLAQRELVVSNDSFPIHMAAALDIPTVGIYLATDPNIWGAHSREFSPVASGYIACCGRFKADAGNCSAYYGGCPAPCKDEVTPERVFSAIECRLSQLSSFPYGSETPSPTLPTS